MFTVKRSVHNPILQPIRHTPWEACATFNPSPGKLGLKHFLLYRAMSENVYHEAIHLRLSTIGIAESHDGVHYDKHRQFIVPDMTWNRFGCEDPRVTKIGDTYYIFYTALSLFPFSKEGIHVAVAITKDFKKIKEEHLVTPFNAKAMTLFPEKVNGKYMVVFSYHTDSPPAKLSFASVSKISDFWSPAFWQEWEKHASEHYLDLKRHDDDHFEVGAAPIKTKDGWLLVYSHIQHYGKSSTIFGVEALMLDRKNPLIILGRTHGPFLTPDETYERYGQVPNVIFPSGATLEGEKLHIYYGAADTSSCRADVNINDLLAYLRPKERETYAKRFVNNPILTPDSNHSWESKWVFNPAAIDIAGKINILYRAQGRDNTSVIGLAESRDSFSIDKRYPEPIYVPRAPFEEKLTQNGNSGCEDPRLTLIDNHIYMCYTAYTGSGPATVAVTRISRHNFITRNWKWDKPILVTPEGVDDKDACLFPAIINNQFMILHRIDGKICADLIKNFKKGQKSLADRYQILSTRPGMWDSVRVGVAAPPIKVSCGWLMLYHGVSETGTYRVGAALLDPKNPTEILARTAVPILEPRENYEKFGQVPNVVFPCGAVLRKDNLIIYYGGADTVVAGASISIKKLLKSLR